jgi:four helix bundle protein
MLMSDYRSLEVWKKSRAFVRDLYAATSSFPRHEMFGLTQQVRRAATSIPSNIAEGHGRWSRRETVRFLLIARGSSLEVETQLYIAEDLTYLDAETADRLRARVRELCRMLNGLMKYYMGQPVH